MKLAAILDDGLRSEEFYCDYVRAVLQETDADGVMAIMSGLITQSGFLPPEDGNSRAQKLRRAGCGLVVQVNVGGSLLKDDTYYYVLAMMLQKMNCVDTLYLPCRRGCANVLSQCARLMLYAPREYQQALARARRTLSLTDAVPEAVGALIPGAKDVLSDPMNRLCAEMCNALKLSYCPTKGAVYEVDFGQETAAMPPQANETLGSLIVKAISEMDDAALADIFGSDNAMALKMRALPCGSFTELSGKLGAPKHEARQILLRTALRYRYITHSNSALYSYVPSIRILSGEDRWVDFLKTNASAPVKNAGEEMTDLEQAAQDLYNAVYC